MSTHSDQLIQLAQNHLTHQPFDIAHDFEHHQLVVDNCLRVIEQERLQPDTDVLLTAAWWHDVNKSYKSSNSADSTVELFRQTAIELGTPNEFTAQVITAIGEHSFNQTQTHLESFILFDADKIEYVNEQRIKRLLDDVEAQPAKYPVNFLHETHRIWVERLAVVKDKMHFGYSKQIFSDKLGGTQESLARLQALLNAH